MIVDDQQHRVIKTVYTKAKDSFHIQNTVSSAAVVAASATARLRERDDSGDQGDVVQDLHLSSQRRMTGLLESLPFIRRQKPTYLGKPFDRLNRGTSERYFDRQMEILSNGSAGSKCIF